ncbi:MAG: HD domain-containing protein [Candidatus Methylomirabilales bacterium]
MHQSVSRVLARLRDHPLLRQVGRAADEQGHLPVYVVGGFVRDALLERSGALDIDLVCADPSSLATVLQKRFTGTVVSLGMRVQRVVFPWRGEPVQVDISPLKGSSIVDDLHRRDFTVNACAFSLGEEPPCLIDPTGGLQDLAAGRIRMTDPQLLAEDPLRLLRAVRLAAQLHFGIDESTIQAIHERAALLSNVAGERLREELFGTLDCSEAGYWLGVMDDLALLEAVFPEIRAMRGCLQGSPHRFDVLRHSIETVRSLDRILLALPKFLPRDATSLIGPLQAEVEGGISRRALLRFTALLHDVGKPDCRSMEEGQIRFLGHAVRGAGMVEEISGRLRLGSRATTIAVALVRDHLRPLFLRQSEPITPRARYRFWRDLGDVSADLLLLSLADIRATWGGEGRAFRAHLRFVREMFAFQREQIGPTGPRRLMDGDELMTQFDLSPGPFLGFVLERIQEEASLGTLKTKEDAVEYLQFYLKELREEFVRTQSVDRKGKR